MRQLNRISRRSRASIATTSGFGVYGRRVSRSLTAAKLLLLAAVLISVQPAVTLAAPCAAPRDLADGWAIETNAQAAGFDAGHLCDVLNEFAGSDVNFHGLLIERHGRLVAEMYRRGKDQSVYSLFASTTNFDAATRHDLRSVTKSIVSLLWGIAQQQGKTPPLNTHALDLFPELSDLKNGGRDAITLEHLFTMTSGLDWSESGSAYGMFNVEFGLFWHSSQARYLFDRARVAPVGTRFNYNGGGTAVLAQILAKRVGMSLPDYARKYLFEPLGITDWEWKNDLRGRPLAFAGLRMRPRDVARIGRMVLAGGKWQGSQIVPADWLNASLRAHIDADYGLRYGYQWWVGQTDAPGRSYDWSAAFGNGGQKLFLLPGLDMVVVMTAGDYSEGKIYPEENKLLRRIVGALRESSNAAGIATPANSSWKAARLTAEQRRRE